MNSKRRNYAKLLIVLAMTLLFACKTNNDVLESEPQEEQTNDKSPQEDSTLVKFVKFGKFEQDGNASNGKEDIEWTVLEDTGKEQLLMSRDILYAMPFDDIVSRDENNYKQDWEKSSLRKWLNEDFFVEAFDENEKQIIVESYVKNGKIYGINNSTEASNMGADTYDKVYILSKDEIRKYLGFENLGANENYIAKASRYAKKILDEEKSKENIAVWHKEQEYEKVYDENDEYWIRSSLEMTSMSAKEYFTDIVDKRGHISNHGYPYFVSKVDRNDNSIKERFYNRGVRPVIRIVGTNSENAKEKEVLALDVEPKIYSIEEINKAHVVSDYDKSKTYKDFDTVIFGTYEKNDPDKKNNKNKKNNDEKNDKDGIEWIVLKKENNKALLLSKYIIDYVEYSNVLERYVVWKDSRLRAWANYEFYNNSFSEKEKVLIAPVSLKNYDNPVYGNTSGEETIDKVFVPSYDELMSAFDIDYDECIRESFNDQKRIGDDRLLTVYTDYALKKYSRENYYTEKTPLSDFWLRNQGRSGEGVNSRSNNAMTARQTIDFEGSAYDYLQYSKDIEKTTAINPKIGFRPCIYVTFE